MSMDAKDMIKAGRTALGIEFGSTRMKAVLVDEAGKVLASGSHDWENQYVDGIWTYSLEALWDGLKDCYRNMADNVKSTYGIVPETIGVIGFSGMMHGYLPFDKEGTLLTPFRTWRNNITAQASEKLTEAFRYNIPQRWSIAHLYQAILNGEEHIKKVDFFTTLAGYVHWQLTGKKVLGVGEASGMFPIDVEKKEFNQNMISTFNDLIKDNQYPWELASILPRILVAGEDGGTLTAEGARLLDPSGALKPGIPFCPPESDGGTGMVATNSVAKRTANVSAGTSVFAMVVLEKELSRVYREIDMVTTPAGDLVAMVHSNNCTSDLNAWVNLFKEFAEAMGMETDLDKLYRILYEKALKGETDCGGLLSYCYFSGEHITGFEKGCPLFLRAQNSNFTLANFMRAHLFTCLGALKLGLNILYKEGVKLDQILGHGGLFKTKEVGQRIMAAAAGVPVSVMETAGEGGAWGIALLASYRKNKEEGETLDAYLDHKIFACENSLTIKPDTKDMEGFEQFMEQYVKGLSVERAAVDIFG